VPLVENRYNTRWTDPWFISSETKYPEEAWEFVKFVTSHESQVSFAEYVAFPPSRRSALEPYLETVASVSGMSAHEVAIALGGALDHGRRAWDESIAGTSAINPILDEEFEPMLAGEVDVSTALRRAEDRANAVLQDFVSGWGR